MKTLIAFVLVGFVATGCKQGRGERCQVDSDCSEGNCSLSEPKVCGGDNASQLDADLPVLIDAPDAAPIDARDGGV